MDQFRALAAMRHEQGCTWGLGVVTCSCGADKRLEAIQDLARAEALQEALLVRPSLGPNTTPLVGEAALKAWDAWEEEIRALFLR